MLYFCRDAVATAGIVGCFVLVATIQGGSGPGRDATDDSLYETTGSIGHVNSSMLRLSEQQRERIHRALMRFPDATRTSSPAPVLADRVPSEQALEDVPPNLTEEIPPLQGHKLLKLSDRILVVDPTSRKVVAMISRYRLIP